MEVLPPGSDIDYANVTVGGVRQSLAAQLLDTNPTPTPLTTVGAGLITAALFLSGVVQRSGPTSAFTDTTDTAANIIAAFPPGAAVGGSFLLAIINSTAYPETLAAGTGVTINGPAGPIPANSTARCVVTFASASTVTLTITSIAYNASGGYDPSTVQTQFGSSTATFLEEGNLSRYAGAGISPGSTGNDNVLFTFTIPANAFDAAGRGVTLTAAGSFAANGNTKTLKVIFNATTAVVGSAVTGGTTVASSGAVTTNSGGWWISANVFKYGAAGSNTQYGTSNGAIAGTTHVGVTAPIAITATESAPILCCITGNAATTATDIVMNWAEINAMN